MTEGDVRDLLPEYLLGTLDADRTAQVESALAASPELRREADALARVLFALPEELEPEPLPEDAWSRLRAAVRSDAGTAVDQNLLGVPYELRSSGDRRVRRPTASRSRSRFLASGAALAASLVLLVALGAWGLREAQMQAQLADEQRIIAYWMRNPNLQIVALDGVGPGVAQPGAEAPEIPPGVVCILPDGRAMLLQPYAAPAGTRYVLFGVVDERRIELGSTDDRFLLFEAGELSGVELALAGRMDGVVAQARF